VRFALACAPTGRRLRAFGAALRRRKTCESEQASAKREHLFEITRADGHTRASARPHRAEAEVFIERSEH
jgi:hypothetical protein